MAGMNHPRGRQRGRFGVTGHGAIATKVRYLYDVAGSDREAFLAELTRLAAAYVGGVDHAGITLVSAQGRIRSLAATDGHPLVFDNLQRRYRTGPCVELAGEYRIARVADFTGETRWPGLTRAVLRSTPIRSMLAFPVLAPRGGRGTLNLFADRRDVFDAAGYEMGFVLASHAELVIEAGPHRQRVRAALAGGDVAAVIAQAIDVAMARFGIDATDAVSLLCQLSGQRRQPVHRVARQLVTP
jgi:hypothetical protein